MEQSEAIAALLSEPGFQAGDIDADAVYHRINFASALQRSELLGELVARLRMDFTAEAIVAARVIEQRLYEQTWDLERYDLPARLDQLRVPKLLVHGDADLIPVEFARHIAEAIPGAQLEVLSSCGHSPISTNRTGLSTPSSRSSFDIAVEEAQPASPSRVSIVPLAVIKFVISTPSSTALHASSPAVRHDG